MFDSIKLLFTRYGWMHHTITITAETNVLSLRIDNGFATKVVPIDHLVDSLSDGERTALANASESIDEWIPLVAQILRKYL